MFMVRIDFVLRWHFAVSKYYNIPLAQLLYAGDDVSGEVWDFRNWNMQENIRYNLLSSAIEAG